MTDDYSGYDKTIKETLITTRIKNLPGTRAENIRAPGHRLETTKLTQAELIKFQKQLEQPRAH
jgi:hypothetical protein